MRIGGGYKKRAFGRAPRQLDRAQRHIFGEGRLAQRKAMKRKCHPIDREYASEFPKSSCLVSKQVWVAVNEIISYCK